MCCLQCRRSPPCVPFNSALDSKVRLLLYLILLRISGLRLGREWTRLLPTTTLRLRGNSRRRGQCGIQEAGHRLDHVLGARDGESREPVQLAFNLRGRLASNIYKQPELRVLTLKTIPIWSPPVPSANSIFEYSYT